MNDVIQAISTVGFPIVSFFVAVYGLKYSFDASNKSQEKAMEQVAELAGAVNENTKTLAILVDSINDLKYKEV